MDNDELNNRIAEFNKDEKKKTGEKSPATPSPKKPTKSVKSKKESTDSGELSFTDAHRQVLEKLPNWKKIEIEDMKTRKDTNNRHYDAFLIEVLYAAGDTPSISLRDRIKGI
jgi:hypothetical protein